MYNRYIPQEDGTYAKTAIPDSDAPEYTGTAKPNTNTVQPPQSTFPLNIDSGDLLVIVLLLLISAGEDYDQNSALLTLVIYLFL